MKRKLTAKPLKETNPYLRDRGKYESALINNAITSSSVEGIPVSVKEFAAYAALREAKLSQ
jgi:hypothetical protein